MKTIAILISGFLSLGIVEAQSPHVGDAIRQSAWLKQHILRSEQIWTIVSSKNARLVIYREGFVLTDLKNGKDYVRGLPKVFHHEFSKVFRGSNGELYVLIPSLEVGIPNEREAIYINLFKFQDGETTKKTNFHLGQATRMGFESLNAEMLPSGNIILAIDPTNYRSQPKTVMVSLNASTGVIESSEVFSNISAKDMTIRKNSAGELKEIYIVGPSFFAGSDTIGISFNNGPDIDRREQWKIVALNDRLQKLWEATPQVGGIIFGRSLHAWVHFDFDSDRAFVNTRESTWPDERAYTVDLKNGAVYAAQLPNGLVARKFRLQENGSLVLEP